MHQAIEQRRDDNDVPEQLRPVLDRPIRRQDRGELLVSTHQHVSEFLARIQRELPQEEVIEHHELGGHHLGAILSQLAQLARLVDLLDQRVRLSIKHLVAAPPVEWLTSSSRIRCAFAMRLPVARLLPGYLL